MPPSTEVHASTGPRHTTANSKRANNGIHGIDIVVIGAGIGGLTAAIYLRRQGHRVTVLEKCPSAKDIDDVVQLTPNSNGLLRRIGIFAEDHNGNLVESTTEYSADNQILRDIHMKEPNKLWQNPYHLIRRVPLHEELQSRATSNTGDGIPVNIRTGNCVVGVDPAAATVTLENGESMQGDVVIGADGILSQARSQLSQTHIDAKSYKQSLFQFRVSRQVAVDDPTTKRYAERKGQIITWYGQDRRVVMYPCDANRQLSFVCIYPKENGETGDPSEWSTKTKQARLLEAYKGFDPSLVRLLNKAEVETLYAREVQDMDMTSNWVNGRVALLGDAAHMFHPSQDQGAACAMEDAVALAVVLQRDIPVVEITERLRLYERIREGRAHRLQKYSRLVGQDPRDPKIDLVEYTNYIFGHDEWDNSTNIFRKWDWARRPNLCWRMPVGFGPFPGPRQTFEGRPRNGTNSTFTTASIKLETSRTLLQNLFPSPSFRFKSPGTVAYASFSLTTLNKMEWLGGSGYNHLGFYMHGVRYVKLDGEVLDGTFLAVLFEDLADPIISGREELGVPKLYCSFDLGRHSRSYRMQMGWQGAKFGNLALEGLTEVDPGDSKGVIGGEDDQGIFAYKYSPAVGERGKADAEYATFVPHAGESKIVPRKVQRAYEAETASVSFDPLNWEALPTLHHIVSRLAEIPVYKIVGAKIVEGVGVPDFSSARRIE
ncbi:related to salicylate 1-monooxygenase [Cephalotrichum gorgonifer]|uniref:Related to salicylate 1-monooxygenase n=1 Tax=Cephalotrichum gorgonifer TaxID=2041049 RepID=A0AAE8N0Y3_9PEZI|nr:related to salicylate 1-monooxygenase [Cephalotrichum gorgonifer]